MSFNELVAKELHQAFKGDIELRQSDSRYAMTMRNETGEGSMLFYHVMPGVDLAYCNFSMDACVSALAVANENILCVDYCRSGRMEQSNRVNSVIVEYIEGIEVVKVFNQASESYARYADAVRDFKEFTLGWFKATWVTMNLAFAILPTTLLGVLPCGLWLYLAGKTTLANLMARFYDVDSGCVRIGGHDVREFTCDSLLQNFAMVFQNVYLFDDTVAANIAFGRPRATREEIEEAARRACCYDFIAELPQGFDTRVGEGGAALSGGQKQRISIARALLKDAPIVILDEATASVDPENEALIQQAIAELTADKTVVVIAHRLSTIRNADQILVVDGGTIAQRGTHDELMQQPGTYRHFVEIREASEGWKITEVGCS